MRTKVYRAHAGQVWLIAALFVAFGVPFVAISVYLIGRPGWFCIALGNACIGTFVTLGAVWKSWELARGRVEVDERGVRQVLPRSPVSADFDHMFHCTIDCDGEVKIILKDGFMLEVQVMDCASAEDKADFVAAVRAGIAQSRTRLGSGAAAEGA